MPSGKTPPPQNTPAGAPAPPAVAPVAPLIAKQEASEKDKIQARRRGRKSLRIDLNSDIVSGGTGANVPAA